MKAIRFFALLLTLTAATYAHGGGKLKLASQHLSVGVSFELTGSEFSKKEPFTIFLIGSSGRTKVGEVKSDSAGKFVTTVTVPASARPGSYRLVLEASDDDEAATTDVMVMATGEEATVAAEAHDEDQREDGDMPSHEPLTLDRARSPLVTGSALATIVLALAAGGLLLRRNVRG